MLYELWTGMQPVYCRIDYLRGARIRVPRLTRYYLWRSLPGVWYAPPALPIRRNGVCWGLCPWGSLVAGEKPHKNRVSMDGLTLRLVSFILTVTILNVPAVEKALRFPSQGLLLLQSIAQLFLCHIIKASPSAVRGAARGGQVCIR